MNRSLVVSVAMLMLAGALGLAGCGDKPGSKAKMVAESAVPAATLAAAPTDALGPRYEATLAEGIDFAKPGYPNFLAEVSGIAGPESWGRWTDGGTATIKFKQALPITFTLRLQAGAWGANLNKPFKFRIGSSEREAAFKGDPFNGPSTAALAFTLTEPADTLQIIVPSPVPDVNSPRKIGLGLISLKIEAGSN